MRRMIDSDKIKVNNNGEVEINADTIAKTLMQSEYNWESGVKTFESDWLNGCSADGAYINIAVINKVLYFIISATVKNSTGANKTLPLNKTIVAPITLPSSISSKIYRKDGSTVNNAYTSGDPILYTQVLADGASKKALLYSSTANTVALWALEAITVNANSSVNIDLRIPIVL